MRGDLNIDSSDNRMQYNTIIVRYSEIFLKSDFVRNQLQKKLAENIKNGMKREEIGAKVTRQRGRIFIETEQLEEITRLLKHVFGIVSFSPAVKLDLKYLEEFVKKNAKKSVKGQTFCVRVKRTGKHDFTSPQLEAKLGEIVINETGKKVKLKNPDGVLFVEVRDQDTYVFMEKIAGSGGMPLGSQGKVNCYVDSREALVACWLMMKRGCVPNVYHISSISVDVLGNWSYGSRLKKIKVSNVDEVDSDLPLVVGDNLEKDGIKKYDKKFETVLTPVIAFKEEEINEFWQKINK